MKNLSSKDIKKLTIAPREARIIVFKISSEFRFGKTLKNVPPAVPTTVELLCCIVIMTFTKDDILACCQLAYGR